MHDCGDASRLNEAVKKGPVGHVSCPQYSYCHGCRVVERDLFTVAPIFQIEDGPVQQQMDDSDTRLQTYRYTCLPHDRNAPVKQQARNNVLLCRRRQVLDVKLSPKSCKSFTRAAPVHCAYRLVKSHGPDGPVAAHQNHTWHLQQPLPLTAHCYSDNTAS